MAEGLEVVGSVVRIVSIGIQIAERFLKCYGAYWRSHRTGCAGHPSFCYCLGVELLSMPDRLAIGFALREIPSPYPFAGRCGTILLLLWGTQSERGVPLHEVGKAAYKVHHN